MSETSYCKNCLFSLFIHFAILYHCNMLVGVMSWWLFVCVFMQGEVCGLCGNFDGDGQNDFTTQGQMVVSNPLEFGNSWKVSSTCPDVEENVDACEAAPQRHHWAKIMCSIITGTTFKDCHHKVRNGCDLESHEIRISKHIFNKSLLIFCEWKRLIHIHFMKTVWKTRVPATQEETVSASAQLLQRTLKPVTRPTFVLHGELQTYAVSEYFFS